MKKLAKNSLVSICCLAPVVFLVSFATSWQNDTPISMVGSSGVKPFSEVLGKEYQKLQSDVDITVDAGGSGFGIEQVAKGFASIGNASKDPYKAVQGDQKSNHRDEWEKNRIKTITIGWEAICILFVPPKDLSQETTNNINKILYVGNNNISWFYQSFSGWFWDQGLETRPTFEKFINESAVKNANDLEKLKKTHITPYVRTGGGHTSGTASSFFDKSHLSNAGNLSQEQKDAFNNGSYGANFKYIETDEANSRAYSLFKSNNIGEKRAIGSMIYLSSAFVESNRKEIEENGYGIMGFSTDDGVTVNEYSISNVQNGAYQWFRPLNSMVSLPELISEETITPPMKFLYWILFGDSENPYDLTQADDHDGSFTRTGGIPLTKIQFMSMCKENDPASKLDFKENFWASDVELKIKDGNWADGISFGAAEK